MIKSILFVLISSFFTGILYAQPGNVECDKLLAKNIPFTKNAIKENYDEIETDLLSLVNCGVDTIDIFLLTNGPLSDMILVDQLAHKTDIGNITYQHLLDGLVLFKQSEDYQNSRTQIERLLQLINLPASIQNWEQDKILFETFGTPDSIINKIPALLKRNLDTQITYGQLFEKYSPQKGSIFNDGFSYNPGKEIQKTDYHALSKQLTYSEAVSKSKELNKPILLYFTGFKCVNAQRMEQYILSKEKIKTTIDVQFIFLPLYVDDETETPKNEWYKSNHLRTTINSVGKKNREIQMQKFNTNSQPLFIILNSDEETLEMIGYIVDHSAFEKFLTEGLLKFKN
ncbi:MAG: thioredoxin family protein [Saprospiraceae bacterium]